jgi:hypothetical protein
MRTYIVNLTNNLIDRNRFDELANVNGERFLDYVTQVLEVGGVSKMRPETLGKIMCEFELGDLQVSKQEMQRRIYFSGEGEDMLRHLVSFCLALAIEARLAPEPEADIPPYQRYMSPMVR